MEIFISEKPPARPWIVADVDGEAERESVLLPTFRVLLIDDDKVDVRLIRSCAAAVKGVRLDIEAVSSIAAALDCLAVQTFDLCISDFWLGHESTLRFLAALRLQPSPSPVIVLTSLSTPEIQQLCLGAGASRVLSKEQLSPDALAEAVQLTIRGDQCKRQTGPGEAERQQVQSLTCADRFFRLVQTLSDPLSAAAKHPASPDGLSSKALIRHFLGLSETARFSVFEQLAAEEGEPEADLGEAVALASKVLDLHGRPAALCGAPLPARLACDRAALHFLVFELLSRLSETTSVRGTIEVDLDRDDASFSLHVSKVPRSSILSVPVTLGTFFARVLRTCRGTLSTERNPQEEASFVLRFAREGAPQPTMLPH